MFIDREDAIGLKRIEFTFLFGAELVLDTDGKEGISDACVGVINVGRQLFNGLFDRALSE